LLELFFSIESMDSWFFLSFPAVFITWCGSGRDEEPSGEEAVLRQIQIR
jgi:hypothetical protein